MSDDLPGNSLEKAQNKEARVRQVDRVRKQCVNLLPGGNAHLPFSEAFAEFPPTLINTRPPCVSYTCWHLLIRLRLTQRDILTYLTDPAYTEPEWPRAY